MLRLSTTDWTYLDMRLYQDQEGEYYIIINKQVSKLEIPPNSIPEMPGLGTEAITNVRVIGDIHQL